MSLVDQVSFETASRLPLLLGLLRLGVADELVLTFQEDENGGIFVLNSVTHKTCEEHGCEDSECRTEVHKDTTTLIPLNDLDGLLTQLFKMAHESDKKKTPF